MGHGAIAEVLFGVETHGKRLEEITAATLAEGGVGAPASA
jgi:hypothetical protein